MMMTARVSRTWSSTRCSMTGIFLSSSGVKTVSCSHFRNFAPSAIGEENPLRPSLAPSPLLGIDRDKQVVALPAQQQDHHLFLLYFRRRLLVILQALDRGVV